jgi:hypothetical protein
VLVWVDLLNPQDMDISKKKQGRDDPALALSQLNIDYFLNLLLNPPAPLESRFYLAAFDPTPVGHSRCGSG